LELRGVPSFKWVRYWRVEESLDIGRSRAFGLGDCWAIEGEMIMRREKMKN
jgi:hypothetical protein